MLREAKARGEKLLAELLEHQAELDANPPDLPAPQLKQGREAMQKAIDSARRMVDSLNQAQQIASLHTN